LRQNAYCGIRIGTSLASDVSSPSSVPDGIVVPGEAIEQLAAGNRPPVLLNVNGYEYRNAVGVIGGQHMISISAAVRNATGLKGEDLIRVTLTVATPRQEVTLPPPAWPPRRRPMSKPAQSSASSPTACSGIAPATSPPPRAPTPGSVRRLDKATALFRAASEGDDARTSVGRWAMSGADTDHSVRHKPDSHLGGEVADRNGGSGAAAAASDHHAARLVLPSAGEPV
jgi:hypothetical protein